MKRFVWLVLVSAVFCSLAASADPVPYLAPGASWKYICATAATSPAGVCPTVSAASIPTGAGPAGWLLPGFNDSNWYSGAAPFGNTTGFVYGTADFGLNTPWTVNFDPLLRTQFYVGTPSTLTWELGVDNGFALWINGHLVGGAHAGGFTSRWEYSGTINAAYLVSGMNTVAVALEDYGGYTAFDMQITGPASGLQPPTVPEPATLLLVGSGLAGLIWRRRR